MSTPDSSDITPNSSDIQDPKRPDDIRWYQFPTRDEIRGDAYFTDQEFYDVLAIICSLFGLIMKYTWCTWVALFFSCVSFAHSGSNDSTNEVFCSFMMTISAVFASYLQNPLPLTFSYYLNFTL